ARGWPPEPLPDGITARSESAGDPADRVTLDESVNMAFLIVLESMTPAERVAFILHDVFRYPFAEVAEIVGRTPAACRQLASSGRTRVRASQGPPAPAARPAAAPARRRLPRPRQPGRQASSGPSSGPGKPRTSTPWLACWTPTPRPS